MCRGTIDKGNVTSVMSVSISPMPAMEELSPQAEARWFLGYMPVAGDDVGEGERGPVVPRVMAMPVEPVVPFSRACYPVRTPEVTGKDVVPRGVAAAGDEERARYTDEDLRELVCDLMGGEEGVGFAKGGISAAALRAAARRTLVEVLDPRVRREAPMTFGRVCDSIKWWLTGLLCGGGSAAHVCCGVTGLRLYRKGELEAMAAAGWIDGDVEEAILREVESVNWLGVHGFVEGDRSIRIFCDGEHILAAVIGGGEPDEEMMEDVEYLFGRVRARLSRQASPGGEDPAGGIQRILEEGLLIRSPELFCEHGMGFSR
jgi:hypothetical protein